MSPALLALLAPAYAQAPAAEVQGHIDQAAFFLKKGWTDDAAAELEAALADPAGQTSFQANWLMAQVRYAQLDADAAARFARVAEGLASTQDEAIHAAGFAESIERSFGVVVISATHDGVSSRLQLEPTVSILDPELKRFVDELALAWTRPQDLPLRVALPAGDYLIQGQAVTARPGEERTLELPMSSLGSRGFAALQVSRLELAMGMGAYLGEDLSGLKPGLETQVGFTQPVAGFLMGVTWDYALRAYSVDGHADALSAKGFALGVRFGRELMVGGPLAFRPSLGYRFGALPGLALDCVGDPDPAGGPFVCNPLQDKASGDLQVYATGRAHVPYVDLAIDWRRSGRTTATGFGVRVSAEQVLARVPASGAARVDDQPDPVDWTAEPVLLSSPALRMLFDVSVAF